jgi:RNA polymerase sigma factor (sigma-70 family)
MNDDAELLRRYAEDRSEAAYTAWVQRHFDLVYSAALRRLGGDAHRARDVAQTVFVDAARQARTLARHPAVVGWLYSSTHFAAGKLIRGEVRRAAREAAHPMHHLEAAGPDAPWEALRPYLEEEMHALRPADRLALLLRFFEQRSFAEVGAQLGVGENGARMRVERALARLRGRLARRGVTSSAAALAAGLTANAVTAAPAGLGSAVAVGALAQISSLAVGASAAAYSLMASKLTVGLAAGLGLLALGSAFYSRGQAQAAAHAIGRLERTCAELTADLQALPAGPVATAGGGAPVHPAAAKPATAAPSAEVLNREIAENPALRQALGRRFLADYRLKYGPLAQTLGLTAAQLTTLAQADLKLRSDLFDLQQAARLMGKEDEVDATLATLEQQVREGHARVVQDQLGESAWRQFQEYDRTYGAREIANQVAAGTFYSPTPLTPPQAAVLLQALAPLPGASPDPDAVDWDGALARVAGALPPAQLAALKAVRAERERAQLADAAEAGEPGP